MVQAFEASVAAIRPRMLAAALSVALHGLVFALHFQAERKTEQARAGLAEGESEEEAVAWLLLSAGNVDSSSSTSGDFEQLPLLAYLSASATGLDFPALPSDALLDTDGPESQAIAGPGTDRAPSLAMYGRYMAQASARVERAWLRPRTTFSSGQFECTVRIEQGRGGEVLSTELIDCNGDSQWQQSLVFAIERASPLPAPPDPAVFTSQLVLTFSAGTYIEGASREAEYAALSPRVANNP